MFALLIVAARTPARWAISIWLRINASSGEISSVGPAPSSRSNRVAMKYTALLPHPVRCTEQDTPALVDERVDRLTLAGAEGRGGTGDPDEQVGRGA